MQVSSKDDDAFSKVFYFLKIQIFKSFSFSIPRTSLAAIETVPMRDVEMKRVIYDESDDRSENDDIALSCTFKSESTFTIISKLTFSSIC